MKLIIVLFSALSVAACSPTFNSDPAPTPSPSADFQDLIQGPNLEGEWQSACSYVSSEDAYHLKSLSIKGKDVVRVDSIFTESSCRIFLKKLEDKGKFRWVKTTTYGGYQVEYRFSLGLGSYSIGKEELLVEGNQLYLSDFHVGFGSIDKSVALVKVAGAR